MRIFRISITIMLLSQAPYGLAASLYKCDTSYQDTPCKGQPEVKPVKKLTSQQKNNEVLLDVSANCAAKGQSAQEIMWKREVGYTLEKQTKGEKNSHKKAFIAKVYKHHGSSLQVKSAIEQECAQQEQNSLLATALEREASRLRSGGDIESSADNQRSTTVKESKTVGKNSTTKPANTIKAEKAETCAALKQNIDEIQLQRRRGGSARIMNELKMKQREKLDRFKTEKCQ